jgi:hypothetical protein
MEVEVQRFRAHGCSYEPSTEIPREKNRENIEKRDRCARARGGGGDRLQNRGDRFRNWAKIAKNSKKQSHWRLPDLWRGSPETDEAPARMPEFRGVPESAHRSDF